MAENSAISWTSNTFNPWWGCSKVSPGCDHCYAERDAKRYGHPGLWERGSEAKRRLFGEHHWNEPRRWDRKAAQEGITRTVFTASMADVFDKDAPSEEREKLWKLISETPNLLWLVLTKRIGNAIRMFPADWGDGYSNVCLMASIVNQEEADRDLPKLISTPSRWKALSMEPLLGSVSIHNYLGGIDWVIVGGESGSGARPMRIEWVRNLRDECAEAGVAFHFKQWGEYNEAGVWVGRRKSGRTLDGRIWDEQLPVPVTA